MWLIHLIGALHADNSMELLHEEPPSLWDPVWWDGKQYDAHTAYAIANAWLLDDYDFISSYTMA